VNEHELPSWPLFFSTPTIDRHPSLMYMSSWQLKGTPETETDTIRRALGYLDTDGRTWFSSTYTGGGSGGHRDGVPSPLPAANPNTVQTERRPCVTFLDRRLTLISLVPEPPPLPAFNARLQCTSRFHWLLGVGYIYLRPSGETLSKLPWPSWRRS